MLQIYLGSRSVDITSTRHWPTTTKITKDFKKKFGTTVVIEIVFQCCLLYQPLLW